MTTKRMVEKAKKVIERTSHEIGYKGGTAASTIEKVSKHINDASLTARDTLVKLSEETHQLKKELTTVKI